MADRNMTLPRLERSVPLEIRELERASDAPDDAPKRYEIAVSSEYPVKRWWGATEILDHSAGSIRMDRFKEGASVLLNHREHIGVVERGWVDAKDKRVKAIISFSPNNPQAKMVEADVAQRFRRWTSVGYAIHRAQITEQGDEGETWRVTDWEPMEVSIVDVPADPTVGVREQAGGEMYPVQITGGKPPKEERTMSEKSTVELAEAAAVKIASDRKAEVQEIIALAEAHGHSKSIREWIEKDYTIAQVQREILKSRKTPETAEPVQPIVDLPVKDRREYSYARAIDLACRRMQGERVSGLEIDVHNEISKHLPQGYAPRGGLMVPSQLNPNIDLYKRAGLDSKTATAGSELVFDQMGDLIEYLANYTAVIPLGARVLPGLSNPITFPKQTALMAFTWVAENPGSDVTQSDLTLGTVILSPKTLMGRTAYSRQLMQIGSLPVEAMVRNDIGRGHGLAIDFAALHGLGSSNEPTGIYAAAGTNVKAMGGVPDYTKLVNMVALVSEDNADIGTMGFITHPLEAGVFKSTLVASAAGSDMIWTGPMRDGQMCGYKAIASSQCSKAMNGSARTGGSSYCLIFGNWSDMLIGLFGALEIVVDPYTLAGQGMVRVISFQMADIAIRHGESFCKATGAA